MQFRAQAEDLLSAAAAKEAAGAGGQPEAQQRLLAASLAHAARAAHLCPWQRGWRLRLAQAAHAAGPGRAAACLRLAVPAAAAAAAPSPWAAASGAGQERSTQRHVATSHLPLGADAPLPPPPGAASLPDFTLAPAPSFTLAGQLAGAHAAQALGLSPLEISAASLLLLAPSVDVKVVAPAAGGAGNPRAPGGRAEGGARWLVGALRRAVHAAPAGEGGWFLLALAALQLAVEEGGQAQLFRRALAT